MSCSDGNPNALHEIAAILADGFIGLQLQKNSPPDRHEPRQKVATGPRNRLEQGGDQSDECPAQLTYKQSKTKGDSAEH